MKKMMRVAPALVFCAMFAGTAIAGDLDEVVHKVQAKYASLKDYEAQFLQETHTARGTRGASGTLYVKVPAKMRWDYAEPEEKHLITDGATSWMVLPGEKQAYTSPLDRSANARVPLQMLTGKLDFKKDYKASLLPEEEGRYRVKIEPVKDGSGFENAVLHIDREELTILRFELTDLMGNRTLVILKNTKMNPGLSASLFSYTPGPDVEVIKGP